jgi:hypothetical protein
MTTTHTPAQGYANTTQQAKQAAVMATTAQAIDGAITFDRYVPLVGLPTQDSTGQAGHSLTCHHGSRNGHITLEAATGCALALATEELATLPQDVDMEARLAAVAITITTKPRFIGVKADGSQCEHTKFGHKTLAQAKACTQGTQVKASKATKALISVTVATPAPAPVAATQATPEAATPAPVAAPETTPTPTPAPAPKPRAATTKASAKAGPAKLRSGTQGQASKA